MRTWSRLTALFRRRSLEREMAEEMRLHLEHRTEEAIAEGMSPREARFAAERKFGGVEQVKEECREQRDWLWLEQTGADFRYGVRQLVKAPAFATVSILTLAIGIGASTAIFSVVNSVILQPLSFPESGRLVSISETFLPQYPEIPASTAAFFEWSEQCTAFERMGAALGYNGNMTGIGDPVRIFGFQISAEYLTTLGVSPQIGRGFSPEESERGNGVVILSHKLWVSNFEASPSAINRVVYLNGEPTTVIGVMGDGFHGEAGGPDLFIPLSNRSAFRTNFGERFLRSVVGRLRPDATLEQANRQLTLVAERIAAVHPETSKNVGARAMPLQEVKVRNARTMLYTLLAAVGALLLIACVNVANLALAKASARHAELSLRTALGATRLRIVRQLLSESLLIAMVGGALGALLAYGSMNFLMSFAPVALPRIDEVKLDGTALAFSLGLTLLTGLGFGLLPAWQVSRVNPAAALNEGRAIGSSPGRQRLRSGLVIIELALAIMLLVGTGLLARSFSALNHVALGYNPDVLYSSRFTLLPAKYPGEASQVAFVTRVLEQLQTKSQIESAAFSTALPFHQNPFALMAIEDRPEPDRLKLPRVIYAMVTPDYFKTMSNPLLAGRWFTEYDTKVAPGVAIVSEQLVKEYFGGENPIGKRIDVGSGTSPVWREIVGVVSDVRIMGPSQPTISQVYLPFDYKPAAQLMIVVRTRAGAPQPAEVVAEAVHAVDPEMPLSMSQIATYVGHSIQVPRFALFIFSIFGGVALLLAAIGIYGVMAYAVSQRTQEIGIRMALGALRRDIMLMVLRQAAVLVLAGLLSGIALSVVGSRLMQSLLYGVSPYDALTFATIAVTLSGVSFLACFLPARRASKVDPMVALKTG